MHRIVAGITDLAQHIEALNRTRTRGRSLTERWQARRLVLR